MLPCVAEAGSNVGENDIRTLPGKLLASSIDPPDYSRPSTTRVYHPPGCKRIYSTLQFGRDELPLTFQTCLRFSDRFCRRVLEVTSRILPPSKSTMSRYMKGPQPVDSGQIDAVGCSTINVTAKRPFVEVATHLLSDRVKGDRCFSSGVRLTTASSVPSGSFTICKTVTRREKLLSFSPATTMYAGSLPNPRWLGGFGVNLGSSQSRYVLNIFFPG